MDIDIQVTLYTTYIQYTVYSDPISTSFPSISTLFFLLSSPKVTLISRLST